MIKKLFSLTMCCWLLLIATASMTAQNGLKFDGSNDYVSTDHAGVEAGGARTIEVWIKGSAVSAQQILAEWGGGTPDGSRFTFKTQSSHLRIETGGTANFLEGTTIVLNNAWRHVAVTFDPSLTANKYKLYIDGALEAQGDFADAATSTSTMVQIGARAANVAATKFNGTMDDLRIWNVARTGAEILAAKNMELCVPFTGLVAYYKFNEGTAGGTNTSITTTADTTGNSSGTLNNFSLTGTASNFVTGATALTAASIDNTVTLSGTTLTAAQTNASYQWVDCANANAPIAGATAATYTPTASGNYAVIISTPNGCTATSACTQVTVCNLNNAVTLNGTTLTATQTGASYQWVDCANANAPIAGATAATYTPTASGNYAVIITTPDTCTVTSACTQVTVSSCNLNPAVTLSGTTLTAAQTGASYQWVDCANANAPIAGATAATYTPTASGNYAVIITTPDTCTVTSACTQVTVCNLNNTVTLSGTTLTAAQTGASYQWVDCANANAPIAGATAATYTPTASGNYAVIITTPDTCTVTSACTQVTVCNLNNTVTLNGTTLTATQTGASYQWVDCANANAPIAGATAATYTPTASGNYAVIITTPDTCTVTSACTQVTVCNLNNAVTLNGTTLTAAQTGASYQWVDCANANAPIAGATAATYTPTASGNYAVIITTPDTCTVTSACTQVTICNLNNTVTLSGTTLTATQTGASYQWVDCANANAPIAGATAATYTPTASGNYAVIITTPDTCTVTSACTQVTICNLNNTVTLNGTTLTATQTGASYQWVDCANANAPIAGATAATYTPTASGNYAVIITTPDTCTVTSACTQVTICNLNNAVTLNGTTLTATQTGASYQWVDCANANAPIAGATAATYTPTASGNYAVIITTPDTCTVTSACTQVTICNLNNTVTLSGTTLTATQTGASYQWVDCANANAPIAGATAATYTPTASGNYAVIITTPDTCTVTSACTQVTICNLNNTVTLNGTTLTATQTGASYQWVDCANANAPIAGATAATYTPTASGNYAVIITTPDTCTVTSACTQVTICNLNNTVTLNGTTLTATQTGASYQWVDCANANAPIAGATAATYTPTASGNYAVIITTPDTCTATSACTQVTIAITQTQNGLKFDGINDYVLTNHAGIAAGGARTIEVWIKGSAVSAQQILAEWGGGTPDGSRFTFKTQSNHLRIETGGTANFLEGTTIVLNNAWRHVAVTFDPSLTTNKYKLYIDGALEAQGDFADAATSTSATVQIGARATNVTATKFNGTMDDLRIWNVARTGAEILAAKNMELCVPFTGLVAYYKFNEGTAGGTNTGITTTADTTGNSSGTLNNFSLTGTASNFVTGATALTAASIDNTVTLSGTTLTATQTGASYQWVNCGNNNTPVAGATASAFTPTASGSYAVIVTMPSNCKVMSVCTQVTVSSCNLNPAVTLNGTTLTATQTGASYQWVDCANANAPVAGATAAAFTPTVSGNYAVIISTPNGCTTTSACTQVTICNLNNAVTLNGTTLTATQTGASYQWVDCANANAPVAGATAAAFTPTVSGNYAVIISTPNGCTATSACTQVTVSSCNLNPAVTLSGTTLTAAQTGASYQWVDCANANAPIAGATAATYTPTASGNYAVIITTPDTCTVTSACTQVTICNLNNAVTLNGTTLTATQTGASYQWVDCANANAPIAAATAATYTPTASGNYAVIISTPNGCTATSACTQVTICNLNNAVTLNGTTLTATQTGASYQWVDCANANAPVAGATAAAFTPTISGNYGIIISTPNGCTTTSACTQVTICNLNNAVTLNGTTLTATQTGASYQWVDCANANAPVAGATAAAFTPAVSGNYGVIISTADGCAVTSDCYAVFVCNVNAGVNNNGGMLMAFAQAGATYQWINCTDNNTPVLGATGQTFTPTASGTYGVIITLENGCSAISECQFVLVCNLNAEVIVSGNILTAAQTNASYQWVDCANANAPVAGATAATFTPTVSGNYAVIISTPDSCTITSDCYEVCVIDNTVVNNGGTLVAMQAGATYQWIDCGNNNTPIEGATSATFTPEVTGNYAVQVWLSGNCTTTSDCEEVLEGQSFDFAHNISTYPNPTTGFVTISMGEAYDSVSLTVRNISGQVISTQVFGQSQTLTADLSNAAEGMYFIDIKASTGQSAVIKIIKSGL